MMILALVAGLLRAPGQPEGNTDFWQHWGDGKGELSSYRVQVSRYGELRTGWTVLIFVTEDISRTTRLKDESGTLAPAERVPVLKLNRVTKFTTGIYDYALMSSTFSSINPERGRPAFEPLKLSFSAQDWCGQVFQLLLPQRDQVELTLHSYFENTGDQMQNLPLPAHAAFEDNLPVWIRELGGEQMPVGERRELQLLPSAWSVRAGHGKIAFQPGGIFKDEGGTVQTALGKLPAWRWQWQVGERTETYWVEQAYPHRILKWQSSEGSSGELQKSVRLPYWQLHGNADLPYRDQLGLPR